MQTIKDADQEAQGLLSLGKFPLLARIDKPVLREAVYHLIDSEFEHVRIVLELAV